MGVCGSRIFCSRCGVQDSVFEDFRYRYPPDFHSFESAEVCTWGIFGVRVPRPRLRFPKH